MIKLNIEAADDRNLIGEVTLNLNTIDIGSKKTNELYIPDVSILPNHLSLIIKDDTLTLEQNKNCSYILINGKRTTGTRVLKRNDYIEIKNTEQTETIIKIKVIDFLHFKIDKKSSHEKKEYIAKNYPLLDQILEEL